ncbi:MAG: ferredoxin--NADP reductase, partial [Bdellovibrionota bacterium]
MSISTDSLTYPLKVKRKIQETHDTVSFVLDIPADYKKTFQYKAGQFVTFFINIKGEELRRSYSISSAPSYETDFTISVKRVKDGIVSNYLLDHVNEGDVLKTTPPAGIFVVPKDKNPQHFIFFAGGSGITPIISIIKELLKTTSVRCSLLYANRNESSIIFHRQLHELNSQYAERFKYEYTLSSPQKPFNGPTGRLTADIAQNFLKFAGATSNDYAFICGPEGFMATAEATLTLSGFARHQISREIFVSPSPASVKSAESSSANLVLADDAVYIGDKSATQTIPKTIEISIGGETHTIEYINGTTVLESALEAQLNPPYSCMDGACMACIGKVQCG